MKEEGQPAIQSHLFQVFRIRGKQSRNLRIQGDAIKDLNSLLKHMTWKGFHMLQILHHHGQDTGQVSHHSLHDLGTSNNDASPTSLRFGQQEEWHVLGSLCGEKCVWWSR